MRICKGELMLSLLLVPVLVTLMSCMEEFVFMKI